MPVLPGLVGSAASSPTNPFRRLRPSDPDWPNAASWAKLNGEVRGRLIKVAPPFEICRGVPQASACSDLFRELKNPYFIGDQVNLTQTTGWVDAWTSQPSVYAVAVETTQDVAAAVNFARDKKLRLVVKGGGPLVSGRLERARLTVDLDPSDGCDDPTRQFCRRRMRGPRGAAAGRLSRRRSDLGSHVQQGDD
jgi:hypothetical protein